MPDTQLAFDLWGEFEALESEMQDQEMLARLRQTWPESTGYLARVGQANNDLSVLRELAQRETYALESIRKLYANSETTASLVERLEVMRPKWARRNEGRHRH